MARTKKTCPIPLLDSLLRNLKNARKRRHALYLYSFLFGGTLKMARTKTTCHIPFLNSLWMNLKKGKNKCPIPLSYSLWRNLKNSKNKEDMPYTALIDSVWRNLKNGKDKEDISYTSLRLSLEKPWKKWQDQRRHVLYLHSFLLGGTLKMARKKKICLIYRPLRFSLEEP